MYRHQLDKKFRLMARALCVAGLAATVALVMAACGGGGSVAKSPPLGMIDQAIKTVQLNLITRDSTFNGYSSGQVTVRVPLGWRVVVYCSNQASTPRSCAIVSGAASTSPVFSGAASPNPEAGLPAGQSANFAFTVRTVGSYRVASLVPGHRDRGMWERFEVVPGGTPSVST